MNWAFTFVNPLSGMNWITAHTPDSNLEFDAISKFRWNLVIFYDPKA